MERKDLTGQARQAKAPPVRSSGPTPDEHPKGTRFNRAGPGETKESTGFTLVK